MKTIILFLTSLLVTANVSAQNKWSIDKSHSQVLFTVSHLVISEVTGSFKSFSGNVSSNSPDFNGAVIDFKIDAASVNTDNEMRDTHLKGDDFFNSEKFPHITFKGKDFKKVSGTKYLLTGDLTMRDVTKPITLDVTYAGTVKDPFGNTKAGFKIKGSLNRIDYNLKWNALTEAGGATVGEEVELTVNMELTKEK